MTEKWAQDCAKYEEGGAAEYLKAALIYEKQIGRSSFTDIAEAVTEAGFAVHRTTVSRRLNALVEARETGARAHSKAFLEAFAKAYAAENADGRGGQTPLDPETARLAYLEGVVGEWDRLFPEPVLSDEERPIVQAIYEKAGATLEGRRLKAV